MKEITMELGKKKILEWFRKAQDGSINVNLKTSEGFVYAVGGSLHRVEGYDHYVSVNGKWIKVDYAPSKLEERP